MNKDDQKNRIADFFRSEHRRLVLYVRKWIDDTAERDGEDIVQEVALNIFNQTDITAPIENLSAYIYQALRNRVVDLLRKRKVLLVSMDSEESLHKNLSLSALISDLGCAADNRLDKKERHQRLYEAIDKLSDTNRAIIIETEFKGKSFKELSQCWEVPLGTLLARKHRALRKIEKLLKD